MKSPSALVKTATIGLFVVLIAGLVAWKSRSNGGEDIEAEANEISREQRINTRNRVVNSQFVYDAKLVLDKIEMEKAITESKARSKSGSATTPSDYWMSSKSWGGFMPLKYDRPTGPLPGQPEKLSVTPVLNPKY